MTTVMCFGTFDMVHKGHLDYFAQAKKYGEYLIVVVARDLNVLRIKGKPALRPETERLASVQAVPLVDKAVLGNTDDLLHVIQDEKPDIICLGYDHAVSEHTLRTLLDARNIHSEIKRMSPYLPHLYKTSLINQRSQ